MLLAVSKQSKCNFETLECIFHFCNKFFSLLSSADPQSRKWTFSALKKFDCARARAQNVLSAAQFYAHLKFFKG